MMVKPFRSGCSWFGVGPILLMILQTACGLDQHILYERGGLQVGLQHDPTTDVIGLGEIGSGPAAPRNDHPHAFDQSNLRQLLGSLLVAALENDAQQGRQLDAPLYRPDELNRLVPWLTSAFSRASRTERVFFSFPSTPFSSTGGRTTGTLFVRHRYLHVALNPFVLPTDGETTQLVGRPITIRAAEPVEELFLQGKRAQLWSKSDAIRISLKIPEGFPSELSVSHPAEAGEISHQSGHTEVTPTRPNSETVRENDDKALQRQVEDLAAALQEAQGKLAGQASELESVKAEMKRLQKQSPKEQ
jgi:hypothetical protein